MGVISLKKGSALILAVLLATLLVACGDATATQPPAATSAAAATTVAASATTATGATTAAAGTSNASTAWINTPGKVPDSLKTDVGIDTASKTIKIGGIVDLTGPASNGGKLAARGIGLYFKALNDRGGIDGYKVNYTDYDSQYSPQQGIQQYNKASSNTAMFSTILGTGVVGAIQPQLDQDKTLAVIQSYSSVFAKDPQMLISGQTYRVEVLNTIDYIVNKQGKKNPKIAIVYQDDGLGHDIVVGFDAAVKAYGVQDAGRFAYKASDKDFTAQATAIKNSGAEYVWLGGLYNQAVQIINTTYSLGFNTKYLFNGIAWDPSIFNTGAKDAIKDALVATFFPYWDQTEIPGVAQMMADFKKYNVEQADNNPTLPTTYFLGMLTHAILKKALESGDATRAGILKAMQSLKDVDTLGLTPPISFGPGINDKILTRSIKIATPDATSASKLKFLTDFYEGEAAKNYDFATAPN